MKFIVENHIPFVKGALEPFGEVQHLSADEITPEAVRDADALLVRTRTRCDEALLAGSSVQFIGTATIGTDHIDLDWCRANGIEVANAPGCNADAVAQYVMAAIKALGGAKTIGIVGVGHVGTIVDRWARSLGMRTLLCDPPRARIENTDVFVSLDELKDAEVITFHTPLTAQGPDRTVHMADDTFFASLANKPIIINAARGPVVDNAALVRALDAGLVSHAVIDTWEGEPAISPALLARADIATPHIAGYSRAGKVRATRMVLDALGAHFGLSRPVMTEPEPAPVTAGIAGYNLNYDIAADTATLKANPAAFESLRNGYALRASVG